MIPIGTYIRQLRKSHNLSLSELSVLADGLSKSHLSEIENGHSDPSLATLQSIAKAFGVGAGDLLVQAGYTVNPKSLHLAEICVQVTDSYGNRSMHRVPVKENGA